LKQDDHVALAILWPAASLMETGIGDLSNWRNSMPRRNHSPEFKLEAVRLIKKRGVSVARASRDLDVHQTMLRRWIADFGSDDPAAAFPGHGQQRPEQQEIAQLRREVAKLKAECDILKKKAAAYFAKDSL